MMRFLALSLFLIPISSFGQTNFYLLGGAHTTTAAYSVNGKEQESFRKTGFQLGIGGKIFFEKQLFFAPQIKYSMKGYKVELTDAANPPDLKAINNNVTLHSIDLAPLLQFDFSKKPSHFFLRGGAAIDLIVSGKEVFDTSSNGGTTVTRPMKFSFVDYGRFTSNAIIQFGYESAGGFMIYAHYLHGLGSLNNADEGPRIRHRVAGVSVGWYITKRSYKF